MTPTKNTDRSSRTWLCSVVFLDIVGYSKHSVDHQLEIKEHFNQQVSAAIADVLEKERIVLDTGDGAALCFLGDPENALFAAVNLRNAICEANEKSALPYEVRIGINLGPVKLIKDVNGRENAVGDGINTAQRIMGFAGDSKILVSRSYYEVISCLGEDFAHLFRYQGVHADKHVRQHTVYEVRPEGSEAADDAPAPEPGELAEMDPQVAEFDPALLERLEDALASHIGPMARVLVRRYAGGCSSLDSLCEQLAANIPDESDQEAFMAAYSSDGKASGAGEAIAPVPPSVAVVQSAETFAPERLAHLEHHLAEILGPMAKVLVKRAARDAVDEATLIARLAEEISDAGDRQSFLDHAAF